MLGAIIGDVVGSVFESYNTKTTNFQLFCEYSDFTDDTVMTISTAEWLLNNRQNLIGIMRKYGNEYPDAGYGGSFYHWLFSPEAEPQPYNSWGNGSAMRVSPVGFAFNDIETVLEVAKQTADVTHNHPEGIKGAQSVAAAIFLARQGKSKEEIKKYITSTFNYNLDFTLDEIRPVYQFDVSCQGSVPQAIVAFLESENFETTIRLAISIGGDSDTIACIAGGIAEAYYKEIPQFMVEKVSEILPDNLKEVIDKFYSTYPIATKWI